MSPVGRSKIEWTDSTWSPVTGCVEVSEGCEHCYAKTFAERWRGVPGHPYEQGFDLKLWPERLGLPLRWRKPRRVFVNSMSDLFFDARQVPDEFVARVFATMAATPQHTYQILTKRPGRMASLLADEAFPGEVAGHLFALAVGDDGRIDHGLLERAANPWEDWPLPNVWLGVSVESQKWADVRIPLLLKTPAAVRFLSCEPLLSAVDLSAWLGGTSANAESRGRSVLGCGSGSAADRPGREDLAGRISTQRRVGERGADQAVPATPSGASVWGVFPGSTDEGHAPHTRPGTSPGLASHRGTDTGWADREPQEWREDGQPSGESGTGHADHAASTRSAGTPARSAGPVRNAKRDGEAHRGAGRGDQGSASGRGVAGVDREGLRRSDAAHLQDRQGRPTISWLIVGGESGPGARQMDLAWARSLVAQSRAAGAAPFVKQLGSLWALTNGGDAKGGDWSRWPEDLRVRQYPEVAARG